MFAQCISSNPDPHTLDITTTAGKLLIHLLAFPLEKPVSVKVEQRDVRYFEGGIFCDSIPGAVAQMGLMPMVDEAEHPAFGAFRQRREIGTLTLANLAMLTGTHSLSGRMHLVENEMGFCQLCDHVEQFHSPLICTSGQVETAVLHILDMLVDFGTTLFHSGNFDVEGLTIATRLYGRYSEHFRLWHMELEIYLACQSDVSLDMAGLQSLESHLEGALSTPATSLGVKKCASYQELLRLNPATGIDGYAVVAEGLHNDLNLSSCDSQLPPLINERQFKFSQMAACMTGARPLYGNFLLSLTG